VNELKERRPPPGIAAAIVPPDMSVRFPMRSFIAIVLLTLGAIGLFTSSPDAAAATSVSRKVADAWPDRWCQAAPKMMRDELVTLMGPPTTDTGNTLTWSAYQYQFNAFLAAGGAVKQLDINTYSLSASEKSALKCATTRTIRSQQNKPPAQAAHTSAPACALVTAAEMSAILGTRVVATPSDRSSGETKCSYQPANGISPSVQFSVTWGDGRAAMRGMGLAEKHEPGLTSPYEGIGDQAGSAGPLLMIRTGEDLVTIVSSGVNDVPTVAKKIFTTAKARM
jgi:hypothetical protein